MKRQKKKMTKFLQNVAVFRSQYSHGKKKKLQSIHISLFHYYLKKKNDFHLKSQLDHGPRLNT